MNRYSNRNILKLTLIALACCAVAGFGWAARNTRLQVVEGSELNEETIEAAPNPEAARAAFNEAAKVFFSARCANCHPAGDIPTQGDKMTPHTMGVTRGPDGMGIYGQTCTTCHQYENLPGEHMPPGTEVPWHMPPPSQKMVFQGLTAGQLCRNFKDPSKNGGHKTLRETMDHVLNRDPLVMWAWEPGNGRTLPPMSFEQFAAKVDEWVKSGGACPE